MANERKTLADSLLEGSKGKIYVTGSPFFAGAYEVVDIIPRKGVRVKYTEGGRGYNLLPFEIALSSREVQRDEEVNTFLNEREECPLETGERIAKQFEQK